LAKGDAGKSNGLTRMGKGGSLGEYIDMNEDLSLHKYPQGSESFVNKGTKTSEKPISWKADN